MLLEEYTEPVTCFLVATIENDGDTYRCYVGEGESNGVTEHFLLIVQVIDYEFYSVNTDDDELWSFLIGAVLEQFGIDTDDGSDDDLDRGDDIDLSVC